MIIPNRKEYDETKALNYSGLKELLFKSPLHYRNYIEAKTEPTKALRIGSYIHSLVLEPEKTKEKFAVAPEVDRRTKDGKQVWEAFCAGAEGKTILTSDEGEESRLIAESVKASVPGILDCFTVTEAMFTVTLDGIQLKSALDAIGSDGYIYDLKTTEDASPRGFLAAIRAYRYNLQAHFYRTVYHLETGVIPAGFRFIAVEKSPPYAVAVYTIGPELMSYAVADFEKGLKLYKSCVDLDEWPGYPDEVQVLDLNSDPKGATTITFA